MAERLTRNNKFSIYNQNNLETMYDKLAEIEDTMEEYGIENVEELSNALEFAKVIEKTLSEYGIKDNEELEELLDDNKYAQNVVVKQLVELQNAKNEENTWKRACELACDDLGLYEDVTTTQLKMKCYYQQAKKGNDSH